jgi:hypothetical protein
MLTISRFLAPIKNLVINPLKLWFPTFQDGIRLEKTPPYFTDPTVEYQSVQISVGNIKKPINEKNTIIPTVNKMFLKFFFVSKYNNNMPGYTFSRIETARGKLMVREDLFSLMVHQKVHINTITMRLTWPWEIVFRTGGNNNIKIPPIITKGSNMDFLRILMNRR